MDVSPHALSVAGLATRLLRIKPATAALRIEAGDDLEVSGRVWIPGSGRIRIGRNVRLVARRAAIELRAHEGSEIVIEDGAVIEDGTSIEATLLVHIGARARIGAFCKIMDNHFHQMVGDRFGRPDPVPISIGDDAVIGPRSVILPGAEVGAGAWLGPAQVLSFRLPAGTEFPRSRIARDDVP